MGFYQSLATSRSAAQSGRPYSKLSLLLTGWRQGAERGLISNDFLLVSFTSCLRFSAQLKVSYLRLPGVFSSQSS